MRVSTAVTIAALVCAAGPSFAQGDPAPPVGGSGGPANLCRELVAFVHQPDAATKAAEPPAQLATAVTAKKAGDASAQPAAPGTPQNTSGLSGQVTQSGPGAAGPQGSAQNNAAPAGSTATAAQPPQAQPTAPRPSAESVEQVEKAAAGNDLPGCRAAAQTMRRAGVVMPPPLLALSALSPALLK